MLWVALSGWHVGRFHACVHAVTRVPDDLDLVCIGGTAMGDVPPSLIHASGPGTQMGRDRGAGDFPPAQAQQRRSPMDAVGPHAGAG